MVLRLAEIGTTDYLLRHHQIILLWAIHAFTALDISNGISLIIALIHRVLADDAHAADGG